MVRQVSKIITGGVFALDLSLSTAWAYAPIEAPAPIFGTWLLPGTDSGRDVGHPCKALDNELHDALALYRPCVVIKEQPLPYKRQTSQRLLLGLDAHVESACARKGVPCEEAMPQTMRLAVLGRGTYPKGQAKLHVQGWCRRRGIDFANDDEADVCLIWQYKVNHLRQAVRVLAERASIAAQPRLVTL